MAAMMGGGMNNWMNNPFAYLMFLTLFRNGGFGAGTATQGIETQAFLLAELNPMYKEKQETEQRFGKIEKSISGMEELMKKQQEMMENFIKKFES